jgi:hypothetical protein
MRYLFHSILLLLSGITVPCCQNATVRLFDGKSLEGWICEPASASDHWFVENGMLVGENLDQQASILWTTGEYGNFELELEYMTPSGDYDSGVFIRGESHQVQIGISRSLQKDMTACIYAPVDGRGSYPAQSDKVADFHHPGEWNQLKIMVTGSRIRTFLNGEPFVDYQALQMPGEGPIGLQLHGGVHMIMKFRNIRLREYPVEGSLQ